MTARVIRLRPADPAVNPRTGARPATYPPRRPRHGHHPDCPYPHTPAEHCGICRSIAIAADTEPEPGARPLRAVPDPDAER